MKTKLDKTQKSVVVILRVNKAQDNSKSAKVYSTKRNSATKGN